MLIPYPRFSAACVRLTRYKFKEIERRHGPLSDLERVVLMRRAVFKWAGAKLIKRLWARGHIVIDPETREVLRRPAAA